MIFIPYTWGYWLVGGVGGAILLISIFSGSWIGVLVALAIIALAYLKFRHDKKTGLYQQQKEAWRFTNSVLKRIIIYFLVFMVALFLAIDRPTIQLVIGIMFLVVTIADLILSAHFHRSLWQALSQIFQR